MISDMEDNTQNIEQEEINKGNQNVNDNPQTAPEHLENADEKDELALLEEKLSDMQDKYLRLSAEFDNYRKRTLKERFELIKTAGEETIQGLLPVIDDFERAIGAIEQADDKEGIKNGILLIYDKLLSYLKQKGLTEADVINKEFDTDNSEAIAKVPVTDKDKKGKVIDVVQKGYLLNDKIIRFAKVVVGE